MPSRTSIPRFSMRDYDSLHRFVFERLSVRGELARLDTTWQTVLARREYPPPVQRLLGEALVATALLAATVKYEGLLTLQLQAAGPLRLIVVQCTGEHRLRALARWDEPLPDGALADLCGAGTLALTIEPNHGPQRYQGLVELRGATLAAALEHYFNHSEQLPTQLHLMADAQTAAGLLLQRLPGETDDADAWDRISALGLTLSDAELRDLDARHLLHRLFHEDDVRLFNARPLGFRCTCSRERTAAMLRALGAADIDALLAEQGRVGVRCEFCGQDYGFDAVDVAGLFRTLSANRSDTRH